jgi:hypothetical protein
MKRLIILISLLSNLSFAENYKLINDQKINDIKVKISTNALQLSEITEDLISDDVTVYGYWKRPGDIGVEIKPEIKNLKLKNILTKVFLNKLQIITGVDIEKLKKKYILRRDGNSFVYRDPLGLEKYFEFSVVHRDNEIKSNFKLPSGQIYMNSHLVEKGNLMYIDLVSIKNFQGRQRTLSEHEIEYTEIDGVHLPSKLISNFQQNITADSGRIYERNFTEITEFSEYEVNKSRATEFFIRTK